MTGCGRTEEYVAVVRAQSKALQEVVEILSGIRDAKDMAAAHNALDERLGAFDRLARRASALPQPPPAEVYSRTEDDRFFMERSLKTLTAEVQRVKDLPGGMEFFDRYQGKSSLFAAALSRSEPGHP